MFKRIFQITDELYVFVVIYNTQWWMYKVYCNARHCPRSCFPTHIKSCIGWRKWIDNNNIGFCFTEGRTCPAKLFGRTAYLYYVYTNIYYNILLYDDDGNITVFAKRLMNGLNAYTSQASLPCVNNLKERFRF